MCQEMEIKKEKNYIHVKSSCEKYNKNRHSFSTLLDQFLLNWILIVWCTYYSLSVSVKFVVKGLKGLPVIRERSEKVYEFRTNLRFLNRAHVVNWSHDAIYWKCSTKTCAWILWVKIDYHSLLYCASNIPECINKKH